MKEINDQVDAVEKFVHEYNPMMVSYCSVRQDACLSCGLLYWEKDNEYRYTMANEAFCNTFYDISYKDMRKIIGKTDIELITEYRKTNEHTFGELCFSTDQYVAEHQGSHRFFEFGYKKGSPLLLDVTKTAIMNSNREVQGLTGRAIDFSSKEKDMMFLIDTFLKNGIAKRLDKGKRQGIAVYLIQDRRKKFNRRFPK